jgi:DNA-binding transcriptional regulator YdaS (Cro superfamily)
MDDHDAGQQLDARKRQLIERASKLVGQEQLARRLNVSPALLEAWLSGDATLPDGKLMELARVMDKLSREERGVNDVSGASKKS